jgi:hypothetical protein
MKHSISKHIPWSQSRAKWYGSMQIEFFSPQYLSSAIAAWREKCYDGHNHWNLNTLFTNWKPGSFLLRTYLEPSREKKWRLESTISKRLLLLASSASYRLLLVCLNIVEEDNELPIGWAAYGHRFKITTGCRGPISTYSNHRISCLPRDSTSTHVKPTFI